MLFYKLVRVEEKSMEPTLIHNNVLLLKKNVSLNKLQRNDIIFFKSPVQENFCLVKRIIGLPNENIKIYSNNTYIVNNQKSSSTYNNDSETWIQYDWNLSSDEFAVLGDNLIESQDSRFFGPIHFESIIGKIVLKLKPLARIR